MIIVSLWYWGLDKMLFEWMNWAKDDSDGVVWMWD